MGEEGGGEGDWERGAVGELRGDLEECLSAGLIFLTGTGLSVLLFLHSSGLKYDPLSGDFFFCFALRDGSIE